jgi:predicted ATPase
MRVPGSGRLSRRGGTCYAGVSGASGLDRIRGADTMFLKILAHPVFTSLNFHMPMIVDLSHPLVMLTGENGSGKSTLLHSIYYALRGEQVDGYVYKLEPGDVRIGKVFLFDAEQHNPRMQLDFFKDDPRMLEFLQMASHGQVMLAMFSENFPSLPEGTFLLLDEPEMALSVANQRRILQGLVDLVEHKRFRIIAATHSPVFIEAKETYVINLDRHINRHVYTTDRPM